MKRAKRAPMLTLDALDVWFDTVEPPAHCGGVSMMNGFLTGLAAGPAFLLPNDWMWHVIGDHEEHAFIGGEIQAVVDTVVDHYNLIAHQLAKPGAYAPLLMRTEEGEVLTGDWADGFFGAIQLALPAWMPLFTKKETGEPAMAILLHISKPEMAAMLKTAFPPSPGINLKETWRALPTAVEAIYRHCEPLRSNPGAATNAV